MRLLYWLLPYLLHTLALPIEPPHINNSLQSSAILRRWSLNLDHTMVPRDEVPPTSDQEQQGKAPILNSDHKPHKRPLSDLDEGTHSGPKNIQPKRKVVRFASPSNPSDTMGEDGTHSPEKRKTTQKKFVRFASPPNLVQVKERTPSPSPDPSDTSESTLSDSPSPPPSPVDHSISLRRSKRPGRTPPTLSRSKDDRFELCPDGRPSNFFNKDPNPDPKDA
ncbi:hypothetical protein H0H93_000578 [Arthromyces matolae]|nr:hypothetical protein H0H93_000578 [Arthromyces matolae]